MNVLPLVVALLLILSVVTIEKFEKFKNSSIIQKEYQHHIEEKERAAFNLRQKNISKLEKEETENSRKQLSFRFFVNQEQRKKGRDEENKQVRLITVDFLKILYGQATFFQELEQKRPNFIDEILDGLVAATDQLTKIDKIRIIEDISRIQIADEELQEAFYKMLKGSTTKKEIEKNKDNPYKGDPGKSYLSLIQFLNIYDKPLIKVRFASRELLKAIFEDDDLVESIIKMRKEFSSVSDHPDKKLFEEFKGKQRNGISDDLLNFEIIQHRNIAKFD